MKDNATGKRRRRRRYSDEERETILADAKALGVAEAARKHGMPQTTVSNWRNRPMAAKRQTAAEEPMPAPSSPKPLCPRVAKRYTPSQKAEIVEYAAAHSVLEASRHFGASRFAIYDWQKRVAKAARGEGPSPTSGPSQSEIEEQRDREILGEWHKHRGLGPSQIKNQLARRSIKVSVATVRHVMEDAGYRPPKVKRTPHDERYESVRPNHRWHLRSPRNPGAPLHPPGEHVHADPDRRPLALRRRSRGR